MQGSNDGEEIKEIGMWKYLCELIDKVNVPSVACCNVVIFFLLLIST